MKCPSENGGPHVATSVVAEGRDNAIYRTACNTPSAMANDPNRPFRKPIRHLCDNSPTREPLRHSKPTFRQVGA
jgi:hypothetical protein